MSITQWFWLVVVCMVHILHRVQVSVGKKEYHLKNIEEYREMSKGHQKKVLGFRNVTQWNHILQGTYKRNGLVALLQVSKKSPTRRSYDHNKKK